MAASRRCIEGSSFISSLRSNQRVDRSLAHRLADREESALEDVRKAYSWLLRPVREVLVVALTAVGPRRCRENRCEGRRVGRIASSEGPPMLYPGITQEVAPNESQRVPKPKTSADRPKWQYAQCCAKMRSRGMHCTVRSRYAGPKPSERRQHDP